METGAHQTKIGAHQLENSAHQTKIGAHQLEKGAHQIKNGAFQGETERPDFRMANFLDIKTNDCQALIGNRAHIKNTHRWGWVSN